MTNRTGLPLCPIQRAAHDMFRILQNLLDSHPEAERSRSLMAAHDWREATATIERIKDDLLVAEHSRSHSLPQGTHHVC